MPPARRTRVLLRAKRGKKKYAKLQSTTSNDAFAKSSATATSRGIESRERLRRRRWVAEPTLAG
jgi:hypothetical protein